MRYAILSSLLLLACLPVQVTHADPRRGPSIKCTPGGLTEHPTFNQASPGRAEYHFAGACIRTDGRSFGYRADATWTPTEAGPNANASEIYHITATSGRSVTYDVILGGRCESDPWLNRATCTRVGDNVSDDVRALWPELLDTSFPNSKYGVLEEQRAAMRAEYARANGNAILPRPFAEQPQRERGIGLDARNAAIQQPAGRPRPSTDATSLNPQPLPPEPAGTSPNKSASDAATTAAETGIIIVSGNQTKPIDIHPKTPPASAAGITKRKSGAASLNPQPLPPKSTNPR